MTSAVASQTAQFEEWRDLAIAICKKGSEMMKADIEKRQMMELNASSADNVNYSAVSIKSTIADLVTETDQQVEKMVKDMIKERYPEHMFVGEETAAENGGEIILTDEPTWVVDPIDGTTNFVHRIPGYCISIGIVLNKEPVVGVVHDVAAQTVYCAIKGMGAFKTSGNLISKMSEMWTLKATDCPDLTKCLLLTETTSRRDEASIHDISKSTSNLLTAGLSALRMSGSAAMNMCRVAEGSADAYFERGPYIWDVAAGVCILTEAGGSVLHPKTLEKGDILGREFLAIGRNSNLAALIAPHLEMSFKFEY